MRRRQHTMPTTGRRRGVDPAVIRRRRAAVVALALIAVACGGGEPASSDTTIAASSPDQPATSDTTIEVPSPIVATDIVYNEDPRRQVLDVHVPDGDGPFPTIVAIHGGGFHAGSKRDYSRHAEHFIDKGIAFVPINYRYAPPTTHPGQVEDVHCALAWVHENADRYRLDPSHIVVLGASAGGYLTGMLATSDDRDRYLTDCPHDLPAEPLAGAVPMYGFFDFSDLDNDQPPGLMGSASRLGGRPYDELAPGVLSRMSPMEQIDGSEPPILTIHGTLDRAVPSVMSERFVAALQAAGVDAELLLVEGPHAFDFVQPFETPPNGEVLAAIEQFVAGVG